MISQILGRLMTQDIPIPVSGENMSLWELAFNPYTNIIGGWFWVVMIGSIAGLIWRDKGLGTALACFIIANSTLGVLTAGAGLTIFWACTFIGIIVIFLKVLLGRV